MTVSIPLTVAEFDVTKQTKFRETVAATAGVPSADVKIASIESIVGTRRLLAVSIRVDIYRGAAIEYCAFLLVAVNRDIESGRARNKTRMRKRAVVLTCPWILQ